MDYRSGSQIREDFLRFFESKQHRRVHSSSLVPANDPTLLFTNAGMNQFKDVFLGAERRDYTRATTSQKCVRAGGKHNDLENVGFTRRHHTFFEMLGNFSFGDYFKRDAIAYAWELLTSPRWFAIDKDRLYVTIFKGEGGVARDDEAEQMWIDAGVPKERIFEMGMKDNFWQMGDTGPCGPCSEIFYDLGLAASETGEDKQFPHDDQRYMEIWNLVFMQFDRATDPATGDGVLTPLPKPSIDTGMGLERIACVLQGVLSNYQTDLFTPLIQRAAELTGVTHPAFCRNPDAERSEGEGQPHSEPQEGSFNADAAAISDDKQAASLRIIADHARAATFLISDGVQPANEGRGYVLRKILRRGIRHGRLLGQEKPFMFEMVKAVRDEMKVAYPELVETVDRVSKVVLAEEQQFSRVLEAGWRAFEHELDWPARQAQPVALSHLYDVPGVLELTREYVGKKRFDSDFDSRLRSTVSEDQYSRYQLDVARGKNTKWVTFPGDRAFYLYETFGLPVDFMVDAARDAGLAFDMEGFERAKEEEQARARASWKGGSQKSASPVYRELPKTEFEGYTALRVDGARILALVKDGVGVQTLAAGEEGEVVLDATSFYADSGGQVGDVGWLYAADHQTLVAEVHGCTKPVQGLFAHRVTARQPLVVGDVVDTQVNGEVRAATMRNHTGTHLLHAALREVLGTHVKQAGSLNNPARLRFDFSHFAAIAEPELREVETIVNRQILANTPVQTLVDVPIDVAVNELGAMALFGEKYGDRVRVVKIGDFSTELCGGTHIAATGEIGLLKLVGESSVASGVRRVEAISGATALEEFRAAYNVARIVPGGETALRTRLSADEEEIKRLRKELDALRLKAAQASVADGASAAVEVKGIKVLAQRVDGVDKAQMRELVDQLRGKLGSGVVVLGAAAEGKVALIAGVTKDLTGKVQAGKLVGTLATLVGGKGGGRPDLAEAGGSDVAGLDAALAKVGEVVGGMLG
jgi:alanyl-tRNA synthetase